MALAVTLASASMTFLGAQSAAAYTKLGCKFNASGNSLRWQDDTTRVGYATPAQEAVTAWNSTSTQFNLAKVTSKANIDVTDGNAGNTGYDGLTTWDCSGGYFTATVHSMVNRYYADDYSGDARKSVLVHELGHALSLSDLQSPSSCSSMSIMYYSSDRYFDCNLSVPQQDDINGVNAQY